MKQLRSPRHPTIPAHPIAWRRRGPAAALPITLAPGGILVTALPIFAGQSAAQAFPAGVEASANYQSSAGTITSVVRQFSVDGGAWSSTLTAARDPGQLVAIRTQVVDNAGNARFFPGPGGSTVLVQALPVPELSTPPVITGGAAVGETPTTTAASWAAIPGTPAGMARQVQTRFTVDGAVVAVPLPLGAVGGALRVEARAQHTLNGKASEWSDWFSSAPVTVEPEDVDPPPPDPETIVEVLDDDIRVTSLAPLPELTATVDGGDILIQEVA